MPVHQRTPLSTPTFDEPGDLFASPAFMAFGACRGADPDLFFPEQGVSLEPAKRICGDCAVKDECLEYALDNRERFGVWGGTSERERRRLRRERREDAA